MALAHPSNIPLTAQTDARNFPEWEGTDAAHGRPGCRFPKMLTRVCTQADVEAWLATNKHFDAQTRETFYTERAPRVGSQIPVTANDDLVTAGRAARVGDPVVVELPQDEEAVLKIIGPPEPVAPLPIPMAAKAPGRRKRHRKDTKGVPDAA